MMVTHALAYRTPSLDLLLESVSSLPRPILARLADRLIERLDEIDGDPDDEPEEDRCGAGDDEMVAGLSPGYHVYYDPRSGDDDDTEPRHCSVFDRDQSPRPAAKYGATKRRRSKPPSDFANIGPLIPLTRIFGRSTERSASP